MHMVIQAENSVAHSYRKGKGLLYSFSGIAALVREDRPFPPTTPPPRGEVPCKAFRAYHYLKKLLQDQAA